MKKVAFFMGIVFFTTVGFSQNKPDASKQEQKKEPAKTEQVKPAEKTTSTATPAKKEAATATHSKKHKEVARFSATSSFCFNRRFIPDHLTSGYSVP